MPGKSELLPQYSHILPGLWWLGHDPYRLAGGYLALSKQLPNVQVSVPADIGRKIEQKLEPHMYHVAVGEIKTAVNGVDGHFEFRFGTPKGNIRGLIEGIPF